MSKMKESEYCVADAVSFGADELTTLRDELQEWRDNLPESLQSGSKADQLDEAISALDDADCFNAPDCVTESAEDGDGDSCGYVGGLRFTVLVSTKKRLSRSARRDEACAVLRGAVDAMNEALEAEYDPEDDRYEATRDDIESCITDIESLIDNAEGADFPGMYG